MKVVYCSILEKITDTKHPWYGDYQSKIIIEMDHFWYESSRLTPSLMVESGYISPESQRAYMKYELIREISNHIESQITEKVNDYLKV